jgi:hypothetical protein
MAFIVPHRLPSPSLADRPLLELLDQAIPHATVRAVIAEHTQRFVHHATRCRQLPGELLLLLLIARYLFPGVPSFESALESLLAGIRLADPATAPVPATRSAICHARVRWGLRPVVALFRSVCRPLATPTLRGAFLFGRRLMALDSSFEDVADTPANERAFGRHRCQHGKSAFPQLLGTYLVECGTHGIVDVDVRPCHGSIHRAAQRLLRSLDAGMLLLWDSGFHSYALAAAVLAHDAQFLARVPAGQTFELVRLLPDGSALARFWAAPPSRRTRQTPCILVRILSYTITDPGRPGYQQPHRLMTSLLDPMAFPARQLIAAYHERWEIELALDEIDTHLRLAPGPLRSKTPRAVLQELYGLLLAHYAVRALIAAAALPAGLDPDRISFLHAVRLIATLLPIVPALPPALRAQVAQSLLADIARHQLPARRDRAVPRTRKRTWSKHRLRGRGSAYATARLAPFSTVVQLLPLTLPDRAPAPERSCA